MDDETQAVFAQLSAQVRQSSLRFVRLENDATESEVVFRQSSDDLSDFADEFSVEVAVLGKAVEEVGFQVEGLAKDLSRVSLRFRELLKRDLLLEVERKADKWQVESFVTREEFDRMLRQHF